MLMCTIKGRLDCLQEHAFGNTWCRDLTWLFICIPSSNIFGGFRKNHWLLSTDNKISNL